MKKIISGKVRDIYEMDNKYLIIVTTDRISAFDVIIPKKVHNKGILLNEISKFWFEYTKDIIENHIETYDLNKMPQDFQKDEFEGRTVMVKKVNILPYEFIVRGYIFGNMWKAYKEKGEFCGIKIEGEYQEAQKLDMPILTPSTKTSEGHDEYISFNQVIDDLGEELANKIKSICYKLYAKCSKYAYERGIIIADTKFEFGIDENGNLILADEIFTPDSSRFWSLEDYEIGTSPKSFDKQFVRDWLLNNTKDGEIQYEKIPNEILKKTSLLYKECKERLLG